MAVDFKTISETVKNYADDVRHVMPVDKVVLFGSYAKGTATEQSDIDICFFLQSFEGKNRVEILTDLLRLSDKYRGIYFEPTAFPTEEIERGNPFVKEILRTGIEV
ncbi:MAG: nucleotidyltransferase domain-containing protein [Peptococcaceae bacterium]|nr:nucleotidyltransferase domain-containing protein [Peptococcaceae bacterium]